MRRTRPGSERPSSRSSEIGSASGSATSASGRRRPEQRREAGADDGGRVLVGEVVEAQDRLDHAEADDDRGRDQRRDHDLDVAVLRRAQVRRVDRQQEDRDQLREDARRGVRRPGRRQPSQVLEHAQLTPGVRGPARAAPRWPGRSRSPRSRASGRGARRNRRRSRRGPDRSRGHGRTITSAESRTTAAYGSSPITPCSAATVTGSVCETGFSIRSISRRNDTANAPDPQPATGFSRTGRCRLRSARSRPLEVSPRSSRSRWIESSLGTPTSGHDGDRRDDQPAGERRARVARSRIQTQHGQARRSTPRSSSART